MAGVLLAFLVISGLGASLRDGVAAAVQPFPAFLQFPMTVLAWVTAVVLLSVSRNPVFAFKVKGAKAGDKITITWTDNTGDKRTDEVTIGAGWAGSRWRNATATLKRGGGPEGPNRPLEEQMSKHARVWCALAAFAAFGCVPPAMAQTKPPAGKPAAPAQDPTAAEFDKFREVLEEDNPAELFEAKGKELWFAKRGPKNASLEQCDLGLGPGVVKGAYVRLPRYFADVGKVMDAERRILHCMVTLQGFRMEDLAKQPFSSETRTPDPVAPGAARSHSRPKGKQEPCQ